MTLPERIVSKGPKKILALDGGGIRGVMTIEILAEIEDMLRTELGEGESFVLADFFDFVAGTSTGAIIAACISLGMSTSQIRKFYIENGAAMFDKSFILSKIKHLYNDGKLAETLQGVFGKDTTLGSRMLRTLLLLIMRNASTDSPWPISNNPFAKYNLPDRRQKAGDCNLDLTLWQLVRASTAAPVYFRPEVIKLGTHDYVFVDGGMTMYNNPAFQAFLMATVEPYGLSWDAGTDNMLIVSVGTGLNPQANENLSPSDMNIFYNLGSIPSALMLAAQVEQDFLCRTFGECRSGSVIDREVGDMIGKKGPTVAKLFTYMRYNAELSQEGLHALGLDDIVPENVQSLDSIEYLDDLQRIGKATAKHHLRIEDYAGFLR
jgi:uncharacterized protein